MNYNQLSFWLLFAAVYAVYWRLGHRAQNRLLLAASYVFYGAWDYRFLFLLLVSTVVDYIGGLGVAGIRVSAERRGRVFALLVGAAFLLCADVRWAALAAAAAAGDAGGALAALPHRLTDAAVPLATAAIALVYGLVLPRLYAAPAATRRRAFLALSMVANLAILGFFKYCDFFVASFARLLEAVGWSIDVRVLGVVLPPAISFYTFQAMSYTIDVYRGEVEPTEDLADFALFVCFFPHLVAGPIMRAKTFLPQIVRPRTHRTDQLAEGAVLILLGLFKKMVVADNLAPLVESVFAPFDRGRRMVPAGPEVLLAVYAFAFQIYCDFSGYSNVARGVSKWLGFELVVNFRLPYLATGPRDFWRRWHISLSTWLRDYLYIPLGGNRHGRWAAYRNLMITMLLGGLWHGASWTFVVWGLYHGLVLCAARAAGEAPAVTGAGTRALRIALMFHVTCLGWLVFRAASVPAAAAMAARMVTDPSWTPTATAMAGVLGFYVLPLLVLEAYTAGEDRVRRLLAAPWPRQSLAYAYLAVMLMLFPAVRSAEFIYFQF